MLFTFPSRYLFTIDHLVCLALEGGPPRFKPDFSCPTLLRNILESYFYFAYGTITLYGGPFQVPLAIKIRLILESYNPLPKRRFGLFPVRSPLLRESHLISFPWLLRCFSSPSVLFPTYVFSWGYPPITAAGFTHSEISGSKPV